MELLAYLTEGNVANFLLLLLRFAGIIAFFPFFENQLITAQLKGTLIFLLTIFLFHCLMLFHHQNGQFCVYCGWAFRGYVRISCFNGITNCFGMISFGGELISFAMGLTIANAYDPVTGAQKAYCRTAFNASCAFDYARA